LRGLRRVLREIADPVGRARTIGRPWLWRVVHERDFPLDAWHLLCCAEKGMFISTRMVARAGEAAKFGFLVHSHMLRHSCGYKLANDGQDTRAIQHYLGHRSIASTVRYTALAPDRFKGFWKD
jgi:integrase